MVTTGGRRRTGGAGPSGSGGDLEHDRVRLLNLSGDMLAKTMTWSVIGSSA